MPESIRIAFHSFLDIWVAGSYTAPKRGQVPTGGTPPPSDAPQFNFTEWWKTGEGETTRPFDVQDELIPKLLLASEKVWGSSYFFILNWPEIQQEASVKLHNKIIKKFEQVGDLAASIDDQVQTLHDAFFRFYEDNKEEVTRLEKADI